ncbi:MAG: FAD binding domain-containing protein [Pseudomonadota bacterium]
MNLTIRTGGTASQGEAFIAGGTTMVDLMKLGASSPNALVDLSARRAELSGIEVTETEVTLGALTTMADAAAHPAVAAMPAIHAALVQAASPQIREMATLGGNLLQRTRCSYFRDSRQPCNKRAAGSGCPALGGEDGQHAVLGGSAQCIATYPGDFAVAALAFGAEITVDQSNGMRARRPLAGFHRRPGDTPHLETALAPGELIAAIHLPRGAWTGQTYVKLRDRASYAFATASAAVALRLEGGTVAEARIVLGGLATIPWRSIAAEQVLIGMTASMAPAFAAGEAALTQATTSPNNTHRVELGVRAVARAILNAAAQDRDQSGSL